MTLDAGNAPARAQTRRSDWRERRLRGDLGRLAAYVQRLWRPRVAASTAQRLAPPRLGDSEPAAPGARAPQGPPRRRADRAHPRGDVAAASRSHASRRGRAARRTGLPRYLLHRPAQDGRQGLAGHGLRCGVARWGTACAASCSSTTSTGPITATVTRGERQPRSSSVPAARLAELLHRSCGLKVSTPNQIWTG